MLTLFVKGLPRQCDSFIIGNELKLSEAWYIEMLKC